MITTTLSDKKKLSLQKNRNEILHSHYQLQQQRWPK